VLFAAIIGIVLLAIGPEEDGEGGFDAPAACLDAWNQDTQALSTGRHNFGGHGYSAAQVGYLDGSEPGLSDDSETGPCAVVFGGTQLDPELFAAGQVREEGIWTGLSASLEPRNLATLQSEALRLSNTQLTGDGRLTAE